MTSYIKIFVLTVALALGATAVLASNCESCAGQPVITSPTKTPAPPPQVNTIQQPPDTSQPPVPSSDY